MVVLLAGLAGTSFGFLRARQSEKNARQSEAETRVEAETALKVSEFLEDMFQTVDQLGGKPGQLRSREVTIEEFLKHVANKIRMELDEQPRVKARLMATIGSQLVKIGDYDEGAELLHDAMAIRLKVLEEHDPEIANSHRHLGRLYRLQS